MQSTATIPLTSLTRQEQLLIWLRREGMTCKAIAEKLHVGSITSVSRWFSAESIPSWRHRQLVELGIPAVLLPPAVDIPPGPRAREHKVECAG